MLSAQHHNTMPLSRVDEIPCETLSSSCDDGSLGGTLRAIGSHSHNNRDRKKKVLKIKASDLQNNAGQVDPKHVEKVMKRLQSDKPVTIIEKSRDNTVETKRRLFCRTSSKLQSMIRTVSWVGARGRSSSSSSFSDGKTSAKETPLRSCLKNKQECSTTSPLNIAERPTPPQRRTSWKNVSFRSPSNSSTPAPKNLNRWASSKDVASNDNERPTLPSRRFSWQSLSFRKSFLRKPKDLDHRWDSNEEPPLHSTNGDVVLKQPLRPTEKPNTNSNKEFTVVSPYHAESQRTTHQSPHQGRQPRRGSMDNVPVLPRRILSNEDLSPKVRQREHATTGTSQTCA